MSAVDLADGRCVTLRRARAADIDGVRRLLAGQSLTQAGVPDWIGHFWVAEGDGSVVGTAGLEVYGSAALLRSVAVDPAWRGTGLGRLVTERALDDARSAGASEVYLLTTTAEDYFPRVGFAAVARECVPEALMASEEFRGACPASAVVMRCACGGAPLGPDGG
jgi:amino-acid N-acetyltransferase